MTSKAGKIVGGIFFPGKALKAQADREAAAKEVKNAERMRQQGFDLTRKLDWQPQFASDKIGPYQREQSPVARAFLESLLTGANPSSVQGTRLGADRDKTAAQAGFDQQFGGWDALEARQNALHSQTPWAVQGPPDPVKELPNFSRSAHALGGQVGQALGQTFAHAPISNTGGLGDVVEQELARRQAAGLNPQGTSSPTSGLYGAATDAELARRQAAAELARRQAAGQASAPGWAGAGSQS